MSKNQLFKINPDAKIIDLLLTAFGLTNLDDTRFFTKQNIIDNDTTNNIIKLIPELQQYYLPCKSKVYLKDLNEKKCITILRQFLKFFNYKCIATEKSFNGTKQMTYRLIKDDKSQIKIHDSKKKVYVISFDI